MSLTLTGLQSGIENEDRALAHISVEHNGQVYDWKIFIPVEASFADYLAASEANVKSEIDYKEAQWEALTPKTREVDSPITGEKTVVDIDKSEIVRPEIPDYYAKRRAEYPAVGEQFDAQWKGGDAAVAMQAKVQAVKNKYPKPPWNIG